MLARGFFSWFRKFLILLLQLWERPLFAFFASLVVYSCLYRSPYSIFRLSAYPYYNYLADAFLHGQTNLRLIPPSGHDLSLVNGRWYTYWAPMPALLLMPFIALFGFEVSDQLFTVFVGACNVALVTLLFRALLINKVVRTKRTQRALLSLCFAMGSVHAALAPFGRVWFTGQIVGFFFVALSYLAALCLTGRRAFLCAGFCLGAAFLTRPHLMITGLWPFYYLLRREKKSAVEQKLLSVISFILPVLLFVLVIVSYNYVRFGDPFETGISTHRMAARLAQGFRQHGAFSMHYFPTNFYYHYLFYPFPIRPESSLGGSLFLLTPVFFFAIRGLLVGKPQWSPLLLSLTIISCAVPIEFLMGTGWVQFGPRYTLDYTVPLLVLVCFGICRTRTWVLAALTFISVLHYFFGARWLGIQL